MAWVLAHRIEHIALVDAQWLRQSMLEDVIGLASVTGTTLWLVAQDPLEDEYEAALELWPLEHATKAELNAVVEAAGPEPELAASEYFPAVPTASFLTFRAETRDALDPESFAVVDQRFTGAFAESQAWLARHERVDEESVLSLVRSELRACSCTDEMLSVLRAVQAAAFRGGWLVSMALNRLVVSAKRASAAAIHSPGTWVRLRAYREPYRGAACALAAAEVAPDTMTGLRLGDIDAEGVAVRPGARHPGVQLPAGAEVYLRSQLWYRRMQGAADDDLLFVGDNGPMRPRYLGDAIRAALSDVGCTPLLPDGRARRGGLQAMGQPLGTERPGAVMSQSVIDTQLIPKASGRTWDLRSPTQCGCGCERTRLRSARERRRRLRDHTGRSEEAGRRTGPQSRRDDDCPLWRHGKRTSR